jgi:hypothetical protein
MAPQGAIRTLLPPIFKPPTASAVAMIAWAERRRYRPDPASDLRPIAFTLKTVV